MLAPRARAATPGYVVPDRFLPQMVRIKPSFAPGQIFIVTRLHYLYFVTEPGQAMRYGIGVGKEGLAFQGQAVIQVKKKWPTWRPTDEMIERDPRHYGKYKDNTDAMPGGPGNPLGARAMYLFQNGRDTYFRIHGTIEPQSIGRSVSSGCIRMINEHVMDLYERVPIGTVVNVI
ncbi:L,D-transpeptidase [Frigidibacter sp. SLM-1]|nr:L,D-transpeptidase [Frigidibacter sp. ROC022]MCR8725834.1 L,D-transpeptidase [Frigidibacter sp. ROC022]